PLLWRRRARTVEWHRNAFHADRTERGEQHRQTYRNQASSHRRRDRTPRRTHSLENKHGAGGKGRQFPGPLALTYRRRGNCAEKIAARGARPFHRARLLAAPGGGSWTEGVQPGILYPALPARFNACTVSSIVINGVVLAERSAPPPAAASDRAAAATLSGACTISTVS